MIFEYFGFRIYCGHVGWGWNMVGVGYNAIWFFGYSKNISKRKLDENSANE